jgi:DNA helicase-2/ATP-dependent DNA helicase PcrA
MPNLAPAAFWAAAPATLTPAQREAIGHVDGPLLVVAGPGSGKTTVITYRVAYLTEVVGVDPAALLVVTFTRAAADAMKVRTAGVAGARTASRVTFGTFHALCFRILRIVGGEPPKVLEEDEQLYLVRQILREQGQPTDDDAIQNAMAELSRMRATLDPPKEFVPHGMTKTDFQSLWQRYSQAKAERGVVDFDDLLHQTVSLLQARADVLGALRERFHYILVDEFQDTNGVQWELIRLLSEPRRNLCVVGDDDQAIYGWRGASPDFLLEFPKRYPEAKRVTLDLNHRCPPPIVQLANRLAAENRHRFVKKIKAVRTGGAPVEILTPTDSLHEAEEIARLIREAGCSPADWAVIYRTNMQAHAIAQVLDREGIPYQVMGGLPNLYRRWPVQDLLNYLRAAAGDRMALEAVINKPTRYISRQVLEAAKAKADAYGGDLLAAIAATGLLRSWQLRPIEELADHLDRMADLNAPDAIHYVRTMIGYDDYLDQWAEKQGGTADEIQGILAEVERNAPKLPIPEFLRQVETWSAQPRNRWGEGEAVALVTCHKAKGLEFPNVVIAGAVDRLMPHKGSDDLEEERRLMYVAMTRAKERLWISAPLTWEGREVQPSPFLDEALGRPRRAKAPTAAQRPGRAAGTGAPTGVSPAGGGMTRAQARFAALANAAEQRRSAQDEAVRPYPKPAKRVRKTKWGPYQEPDESHLPPLLVPGAKVHHDRHGEGQIESIDPVRHSVIIDFGGKRLSLDLSWCLQSPAFFRVLTGD